MRLGLKLMVAVGLCLPLVASTVLVMPSETQNSKHVTTRSYELDRSASEGEFEMAFDYNTGFSVKPKKPARPAPPAAAQAMRSIDMRASTPVKANSATGARPKAASRSTARRSAPAPQQRSSGGGGGGASYGSTSTGVAAPMAAPMAAPAPPPEPPQLGEDEWRAQDSTYLGEEASLKLELDRALAALRDQRTNYQTDFGKSVRNLGMGWEDANNNGMPDDSELKGASWNRDDLQGAYGQASKNQQDDFVGRGLMDSTFYADAQKELDRGFTRQYDDMTGARNNYLKQLTTEETGANDSYGAARGRARAESSGRRAAQYGL